MKNRRRSRRAALRSLLAVPAVVLTLHPATSDAEGPDHPGYTGSSSCRGCHAREYAGWTTSHHAHAMQHATADTVLGDFKDVRFTSDGITTVFFRRDGQFMVTAEGPDGAPHDYEVRFTFGVNPLQQYLVDFGNGRFQVLPIAWDSRSKDQGGQRWFDLYAGQHIGHGDPLHWTGPQQNWNFMCAECHSTNVKRNYDAQTAGYGTTYAEISVSCESCHGPGQAHLRWAERPDKADAPKDPAKGLSVTFDERRNVHWTLDGHTGNSTRSRPRSTTVEIDTCATCHARRSQIASEVAPGSPIGDHHHVSLLDDRLYFPDGQIREEVYEYGSFLQSRMFHAGVTCSDCHEPHSLKLRADGNATCLQCHAPATFDVESHTHHAAGSSGASCADCHMPARTYMGVHARRDHSIRIPRPDLSITLGVPNACTTCHGDKPAQWAADRVKEWTGGARGFQDYAELFNDGTAQAAGVRGRLVDFVDGLNNPAIARASALARLDRVTSPSARRTVQRALHDPDPLVRRAAAGVYEGATAADRLDLLALTGDPVRDVRVEAGRLLAAVPADALAPDDRNRRNAAVDDYIASEGVNADRPEAFYDVGIVRSAERRAAAAEQAFKRALTLDPSFAPAAIALANVYRTTERDKDGEAVLRAAIARRPDFALTRQALGLWLVRNGRRAEALVELKQAVALAPDDAHSIYLCGIAVASLEGRPQAIEVLTSGLQHAPNSRELLFGLATMLRDERDLPDARMYAEKLVALEPDNPTYARLLDQLKAR